MKKTCERDGTHRLPEGEDSWNSEDCDALVAAGLDGCMPCQSRIIVEMSATLTDNFGKLFTTWVVNTINRHVLLGARLPDTAVELFGPASRDLLSPPSRKALRGVKLPKQDAGAPVVGFSFDTKAAVSALTDMKPDEREQVMGDAMDGIVGSIGMSLPPVP